jgi:hypothetical protein
LKSFLFRLTNPHSFPTPRLSFKDEKKDEAIHCDSECGAQFGEITVTVNRSVSTKSSACIVGRSHFFYEVPEILDGWIIGNRNSESIETSSSKAGIAGLLAFSRDL